jgi:hypothetical protein
MKEFLYWIGIIVASAITGIIIGLYNVEFMGICM